MTCLMKHVLHLNIFKRNSDPFKMMMMMMMIIIIIK